MKVIIDTDAPAGYETAEVSDAKDIVMDIVQEVIAECFLICGSEEPDDTREMHGYDAIESAHNIVEALIKSGWRPTEDE